MFEFLLQGVRGFACGSWPRRIPALLTILFGVSEVVGQAPSADCPDPLTPMDRFVDATGNDLLFVRSAARTDTREVRAKYHRTRHQAGCIIDAGSVQLTNRSNRRRMIRYHHNWEICPQPRHVNGSIQFFGDVTGTAWLGCHRVREGAVDRTFEKPQSMWQLRVEVVLDPGQTVEGWWIAYLDHSDVEYCDGDLNDDGQVDEEDLAIGLGAFGASADQGTIRMILAAMAG